MSDLISRSALIEEIHKIKFQVNHSEEVGHNRPFVDIANVLSCIDAQPTAYNVDAVVEDMMDSAVEFELFGVSSEYIPKHIVINAIRKGGV